MQNKCLHCELKILPTEKFCCNGCKAAYAIIGEFGLSNYYKNRILKADQKLLKPEENNFANVNNFVTINQNGANSINLIIEGLHCAACVWLIENVLKKQPQIIKARINMSNKRLHLEWSGDADYGNKLIKIISDLGYKLIPFDIETFKSEEKKYDNTLLKAMSVAGFAAGNVMLISVALWSGNSESMGIVTRNLLYWVSAIIALPAIIYSGRIFVYSAFNALKSGRTNMDVPISIAIMLISITSLFEIFTFAEHAYFDSAIMLIFFLLIGRYLDFNLRRKAMSIASDLAMLSASSATIIENNQNKIIHTNEIKKDMILLVAAGEKIYADGTVISGDSQLDTSLITGESLPREIKIGSEVFAGMINLTGSIKVRVTKNKDQTLLAQIVTLVENLEHSKNHYVRMADKIAKYYTPIVHILSLLTFLIWLYIFHSNWKIALLNAIAVLIITCPCALALAVPAVQIISTSRLMKKGILIKSGEAIERLNNINTIIFDKTGTLTIGKMIFLDAFLFENNVKLRIDERNFYFQIGAAIASKSNHPLSKALTNNYSGTLLDMEVKESAGLGLSAFYQNKEIKFGKREFVIGKNNTKVHHASASHAVENQGFSTYQYTSKDEYWYNLINNDEEKPEIYMGFDDKIIIFTFEDTLKDDAQYVIDELKKSGKKIILLSGDKEKVVKNIAEKLGISEYYFNKTPIEKCDLLKNFKEKYQNIMMVGDGLNDAPSLVLADVSISPSSASDITKNAADIIFQGEKLSPILEIISVSKKSQNLMKENFALAFLYNLIAVPFAMMGHVVPILAALAMSSSSIIVVLNALRVKNSNLANQ